MSYIGTEPKDIRSFGRTKFDYTATQGQTAFTGADDDGKVLAFTVGQIEVYVNGILMDDSDFTTTGTGTVTLASAANLNDVINIVSFETNIPDSNYVPASGGTFTGNVTHSGTLTASGAFTSLGIDDNATSTVMTLDTSGNAGFGTSTPSAPLNVSATYASDTTEQVRFQDNTGSKLDFFGNADGDKGIQAYADDGSTFYNLNLQPLGGNAGIGTSSPTAVLDVRRSDTDGKIAEFHQSSGYGLEISSSTSVAKITSGYNQAFVFETGTTPTERMRIDSSGRLLVGTSTVHSGTNGTLYIETNAVSSRNLMVLNNSDSGSSSAGVVAIYRNQSFTGGITNTNTSTSFNTSSDYRLKENVTDVTDGITRVKQLAPKRFNFIADADTTVDGFLAHEVSSIVPEAITGTKDAVDDDGNPVYQGIDQSKLVPLLTAALQEAIAKIEDLETRVAALEAQ